MKKNLRAAGANNILSPQKENYHFSNAMRFSKVILRENSTNSMTGRNKLFFSNNFEILEYESFGLILSGVRLSGAL